MNKALLVVPALVLSGFPADTSIGAQSLDPGRILSGRRYETHVSGTRVATGDLDGDGELDVVACTSTILDPGNEDQVLVRLGLGDGLLGVSTSFSAGPGAYAAAVGEANGDAFVDVVVANRSAGTVSLLAGLGDGTLSAPVAHPVAGDPRAVAIAHLDGDAIADIVVGHAGGGGISVLLGLGGGAFAAPATFGAMSASRLLVADVTGSAALDVLVAGPTGGTDGVSLLEGRGDGTFVVDASFDTGGTAYDVAVGDLDGDGRDDLVVARELPGFGAPDDALLFSGAVGGGFSSSRTTLPVKALDVAVGDLDGDLRADLVTGGISGWYVLNVFLQDAGGALQPGLQKTLSDMTLDLHVEDATGEGRLDVLALVSGSQSSGVNHLVLWKGGGDGTFGVHEFVNDVDVPFSGYHRVEAGDLDGDGVLDVVAALRRGDGAGPKGFEVFLGTGDGSLLSAPVRTSLTVRTGDLALADLDGDLALDVVAAGTGSDGAAVLLGGGDGTFGPATVHPCGDSPVSVAAVDVNNDGDLDLVVGNGGGAGSITWLEGDGNGGFATFATAVATSVNDVSPVDLDVDGHLDLVAANFTEVVVALGAGDGTFVSAPDVVPDSGSAASVATGDLDGDGWPDVVIDRGSVASSPVLLGQGDGTLVAAPPTAGLGAQGLGGWTVDVGDVNQDGRLDAWVRDVNGLRVRLGQGDGSLGVERLFSSSADAEEATLADLDGDRRPELVVACAPFLSNQGSVDVLGNLNADPWINTGPGLAGAQGLPVLRGFGTLEGNSAVALRLIDGAPSVPAFLIIGISVIDAPFKGGILVPSPDVILVGAVTDTEGDILIPFVWPTGVPPGSLLAFQWWLQDGGAIFGFSSSNGLLTDTP